MKKQVWLFEVQIVYVDTQQKTISCYHDFQDKKNNISHYQGIKVLKKLNLFNH